MQTSSHSHSIYTYSLALIYWCSGDPENFYTIKPRFNKLEEIEYFILHSSGFVVLFFHYEINYRGTCNQADFCRNFVQEICYSKVFTVPFFSNTLVSDIKIKYIYIYIIQRNIK